MYLRGRRGWVRESGGKGLVCISVLRVCFHVSVLDVKGGILVMLSGTKSNCHGSKWHKMSKNYELGC